MILIDEAMREIVERGDAWNGEAGALSVMSCANRQLEGILNRLYLAYLSLDYKRKSVHRIHF